MTQTTDQRSALVVDDEPGHRMLVRAVLEDAGWRVTDAPSGEAALAVLGDVEQQLRAQCGQGVAGGERVAHVNAAAAGVGGQFPAQDQIFAVQHEQRLDHGLVAARPHQIGVHLFAGQEIDRRNDETLARTGLAGQHIESRAEFQLQIVDEGQIFDAQYFDHVVSPIAAAWGPGCRAGFRR